jgi:hypothetical protein
MSETFKLNIKTGNAAFSEEEGGPHLELARLLREVADRVENGEDHGSVMDINGNSVGRWTL